METGRPKILFFDVNETLLDLTTMKAGVGEALGGRKELLPLWFTTMLHHSLVTTVAGQYADFGSIGAATLRMVARNHDISLTEDEAKKAIIGPLTSLPAHHEVKEALTKLRGAGYTLVSFTNSSNKGVETQFRNAGLTSYFDRRLSVEDVGKYKPHSDAYRWAVKQMKIQPSEALMIAAHGWDVAGAMWAGLRAAFVARPGAQLYPLAPLPEATGSDLLEVADYLLGL